MTIEQLKQYLLNKPSYFKESYTTISERFNVSMDSVFRAFADDRVQKAKREYNSRNRYVEVAKTPVIKRAPTEREKAFLEEIKTKSPTLPRPYTDGDPNNVLVIGDSHAPFDRAGYLEFCRRTQEEFNCGTVVHIGDEVDLCAISQFEHDPDGLSALNEYELALARMKDWYKVFPDVYVCIGNHTARPFRLARSFGLPSKFLKTYEEMWEAPKGWKWAEYWDINGVHYTHGTGSSGSGAAIKRAMQIRQSVVMGHLHKEAGVQYNVSSHDAIFGVLTGCGIDDKEYAFYYAKDDARKSIISCAVIIDGKLPIVKLMDLN